MIKQLDQEVTPIIFILTKDACLGESNNSRTEKPTHHLPEKPTHHK